MSLTYTDKNLKTVLHSWGRFRVTLYEAVQPGDALSWYNSATYTVQEAAESDSQRADCFACEEGDAAETIWAALAVELKSASTVGTGGVVTQVYFAGSGDDLGSPLYLGDNGKPSSTAGTTYPQIIGQVLARDRIMLNVTGSATGPTFSTTITPATDGGAALGTGSLAWSDLFLDTGGVINFDNGDVTITHSSNLLTILGGGLTIGVNDTGYDVTFYGATSGSYLLWDESHDTLRFTASNLSLKDNSRLLFGTGNDINIYWDAAKLRVTQAAPNSLIQWGVDGAGLDQIWYGDTASSYMEWDQSHDTLRFYASNLELKDNSRLLFGTGNDINIYWDGTRLCVTQAAANPEIRWGVNGMGIDQMWYGDTSGAYMFWDQSHDVLKFVNAGLQIDGVSGVTQTYSSSVTGITVVKGIVTSVSGS